MPRFLLERLALGLGFFCPYLKPMMDLASIKTMEILICSARIYILSGFLIMCVVVLE